MNIWFDLSNSPHVNLFRKMIRDLEGRGHNVCITCRPLANTVDLLKQNNLTFDVVGIHHGANSLRKLFGFPVRVAQLRRHVAKSELDVAVSQSSFHSPVVARSLGLRSIYMNDNEHALGNVPSFLCATQILVPECIQRSKLRAQFANRRKVVTYPGIKEGIYLWELSDEIHARRGAIRSRPRRRPAVYIRPEPWAAQYYKGKRDFLDQLIRDISPHVDVTVLPRGADQCRHYKGISPDRVRVVEGAMSVEDIAVDCDLFVGAGGTMTREMAVLGVSAISVYQDDLLDVDRLLLRRGAFVYQPELTANALLVHLDRVVNSKPDGELMSQGKRAYELIMQCILGGRTPTPT